MFGLSKITVGLVGVIVLLSVIGYLYFSWSQNKISQQAKEISAAQQAITEQTNTISTLQSDAKKQAELNKNASADLAALRKQNNVLKNQILTLDLHRRAAMDPKATEEKLNAQLNKVWQDLNTRKDPK